MRRWLVRLLFLVVAVAAVWWFQRWYFTPEPIHVRTAVVERGPVEATITNSRAGTVRARRRSGLSPETSGTVVAILHREGSRVKEGEILFRLDDDTLVARLQLAERDVDLAVAQQEQAGIAVERAERELQRNRELADKSIVSADTLDRLSSRHQELLAASRAAVAAAERSRAALMLAEAELRKTVVVAPFDGIVAEVDVELGEWVTPAPPLMMTPAAVDLIDPTSLYVVAPMDEVDAARIARDQPVKVTVDSHAGEVFQGMVSRVAPYVLDIEQQNRTVDVEVEFTNPGQIPEVLPGTSADVEIVLEQHVDAVRVPTSALFQGAQVMVVEDGALQERAVKVGLRNWDVTEILEGLEPGERVVVAMDRKEVKAGVPVLTDDAASADVMP